MATPRKRKSRKPNPLELTPHERMSQPLEAYHRPEPTESRPLYAGDEQFVYIRQDQFLYDLVVFGSADYYVAKRWLAENFPDPSANWEITAEQMAFIRGGGLLPPRKEPSRYIPTKIRRQVTERDGQVCKACGSTEHLALDHIHPFSRNGKHSASNLQVLCRSCNSRKRDRTMKEWAQ